ncbi:MAG: hypothetical protein IJA16_00370, partial [Clostridia bacterium]|nr:hypothetical protein [Clostridia bacterium]
MFSLFEDFSVCGNNRQSYSIDVERNTYIGNLHAGVEGGEFALRSIGNRFLFRTPRLNDFEFTTHFGFTSIYEFKPSFTIIYSYDKRTRCGSGVSVTYNLDNTITASNVSICKQKTIEIEAVTFEGCTIVEGERYEFFVSKKGDNITGKIFGNDFSFKTEGDCGYLGIQRPNYIGMCLLSDFLIESGDAVESKTVMDNLKLTIPLLNGGDIPYEVSVSAVEENEVCYLYAELGGGTATRKLNREDRPGQYGVEVDQIYSPYICIMNGKKKEKFYFFNGRKVIADPNIFWDCLKEYWEMPEMPIKQKVEIPRELFSEDTVITFGYEKFHAKGYNLNSGGPSEFVFNRNGELIYGGAALCDNVFEIRSPKDKKVVSLIP